MSGPATAPPSAAADSAQLLEQLRDIHMAPEPTLWPLAPGWWVLAFLLLVALVFAGRWAARRIKDRRRRKAWFAHLDQIDRRHDVKAQPGEWLAAVNSLLKVIALRAFPGSGTARMHGREWLTFLTAQSAADESSQEKLITALEPMAAGEYALRPEFDPVADRDALRSFATQWIVRHG